MTNRRDRIPGVVPDAERNIASLVRQLDDRLRVLERKGGRPGVIVLGPVAASPGEFLNIEAPAAGLTVILPEAVPSLRNARVTLNFRNANPVRIVAIQGTVNRFPFVVNNVTGTFDAICDGLDGWNVETGVSPTGNPAAAFADAEFVLGAAHVQLPNGRVATDSTEIDADVTAANVISWALRTASVVFAKLQDLTGLSVLGRAANSSGVMAAITAATARHTLRANAGLTSLEWGYPIATRANTGTATDGFQLDFINGTHTTAAATPSAGGNAFVSFSVDVASLLNAIDSTSIVQSGGTLVRAAVTGAVAIAQNANTSLFAGIRDNGASENDRTFLNTVNTPSINLNWTDDAANDELELRATFLGSFYAENSGATAQTPFVSYDDSTMLDAFRTDNTAGSGYVNISFDLKPQSEARVIGRAKGAGTGIPTALTGSQVGEIVRWDTTEAVSGGGLMTDVDIDDATTAPRFTYGGATGIIRSILEPVNEGQLLFPCMTTGGGDETIYLHEDTTQTATRRVRTPGAVPFRFNSGSPGHILFYDAISNRWTVIGPVGGDQRDIVVLDEEFDWGQSTTALESSTPVVCSFTGYSQSWCAVASPVVTGSGGVANIDNVLHHRGILRIDTAANTNDATALFVGRDVVGSLTVTEDIYDPDNVSHFACWVRIPTATSVKVWVGMCEDPTSTEGGTSLIGFVADTSSGVSSTNWLARIRTGSTTTVDVDTGVAFSTAWHKLEWWRFGDFIVFHVDRVLVHVSTSASGTAGTVGLRVQTLTTAERTLDIDRVQLSLAESSLD